MSIEKIKGKEMKLVKIEDNKFEFFDYITWIKEKRGYYLINFCFPSTVCLLAYSGDSYRLRRRNKIVRRLKTKELTFSKEPIRVIVGSYNRSNNNVFDVEEDEDSLFIVRYSEEIDTQVINEIFDLLSKYENSRNY